MKKQLLTVLFAATAATALAQITDTGSNVGIGNATPASKLDVNGSINLSVGNRITIGGINLLNAIGTRNIHIGDAAGSVSTGTDNAFIGFQAGRLNTTGVNNAFIGRQAGAVNTTGSNSVIIGNRAGFANTTGFDNAMLGFQAGLSNTIGSGNNFFGKWAGKLNTTGGNNSFFGTQAGQSNTTGSSNTYVGYLADGSAALTNATAIGANTTVAQSNSVILGNNANVGIGTGAPSQRLHVVGSASITGAILDSNNDPGTAGQVLSSTVTGTDWVAAAAGLTAGTAGQTLRNDGFTWIAESNLYSDGINVGIGTSDPTQKLHVEGDARISNLNGTGYRTVFADELGNLVTVLPQVVATGEGNNANVIAIPDNNCVGAVSTITLSGLPTAMATSSISITVDLTHTSLSDISIYLVTPDGSILNLFKNQGYLGSSHLMEFNDAGNTLSSGFSANGLYKPYGSMTLFCSSQPTVSSFLALGGPIVFGQGSSNFNPNGIWTLKVIDINTGGFIAGTSTLNSWSVSLDPGVPSEGVWAITGNANTTSSNFIGTTDNQALRFKVNNQRSGILATDGNVAFGINALPQITFGTGLVAIGKSALRINTTGDNNTAIGNETLYSNVSGNSNTAIGNGALYSNTNGTLNTANGAQSLYSNTTGINNTANGAYSLYSTTTGSQNTAIGGSALQANTTGHENTASGYYALYANTTGFSNTSVGNLSLQDNTTGSYNTAHGDNTLSANTTGSNNTAIGNAALLANIDGYYNTASGSSSLKNNTSGYENTATGMFSLNGNTAGYRNTGIGFYALYSNTTGDYNTAIGYYALNNITTGNNNTAIGRSANSIGTTQSNSTGLGFDADPTAANTIYVGNTAVSSIKGQVGFTTYSDQRFKKNVKENEVKGLEFISKLRPVTYNVDIDAHAKWKEANYGEADTENWEGKYDVEKIRFSGFLAQEVEATAKEVGYAFSGVDAPKNDKDIYGLRYAEFVVPLVKAVQEQQQQLEQLKPENTVSKEEFDALKAEKDAEIAEVKAENAAMKSQLAEILSRLNAFDTDLQSCCFEHGAATGTSNPQTTADNAKLEQNIPNPFRENTTIKYYLPSDSRNATITISDLNGVQLKQFDLQGKGFGQVLISGGSFAAGTYVYTLTVNGKQVDSKKMMLL